MANLASMLNDQIRRLARREVHSDTKVTRKLSARHRRDIAELKRQIAALSRTVAYLSRQEKRRAGEAPESPQVEGSRFRADGLRSHRKRLGLSAMDYGRLIGVSGLTVYNWEAGKSRPRRQQLAKIVAVRGLGKREANRRLELLNGE